MKLVIQRVSKASVSKFSSGEIVGKIEKGLFVLVGFKKGDTRKSVDILSDKLLKLRVMADENQKMNFAATGFLIVPQFTLYANTKDGNRPSFVDVELPEKANELYRYFIKKLKSDLPHRSSKERRVETGSFGDYMKIDVALDGPVTIILES
jgi:D-tyrosyl-tRNA(Tyr) deacylase